MFNKNFDADADQDQAASDLNAAFEKVAHAVTDINTRQAQDKSEYSRSR